MKNVSKISLLTLIILLASITVIYSTNGTDSLRIDENYQIQPTSIDGLTYLVFIWTGESLLPEYWDQFEFEAGDVFKVSSRKGHWTGGWQKTDLVLLTFFQAWVEETETTTTTAASTATQRSVVHHQLERVEETKYLINLLGIAFVLEIPPPVSLSFSTIIGNGLYLGADVFFLGLAGETILPEFASITPDKLEQGEKNIEATIIGRNTNFEAGETTITFSGGDVTAHDYEWVSKTEIDFQIDVDDNAIVGKKTVTITYPDGVISGKDEFEVLERTETTTTTTTPESSY